MKLYIKVKTRWVQLTSWTWSNYHCLNQGNWKKSHYNLKSVENSLAGRGLELHIFTAEGTGLIPNQGAEILQTTWSKKEKKNKYHLLSKALNFAYSLSNWEWHFKANLRLLLLWDIWDICYLYHAGYFTSISHPLWLHGLMLESHGSVDFGQMLNNI